MSELPTWARDALAGIYDPCCQEKGISVIDMGLVRSVQVEDGVAKVELLLTSGWCPFAATVLTQVKDQILGGARLNRMEFRQLLKEGQQSLIIGILFLATCLMAGHAIGSDESAGTFAAASCAKA